MIRIFCPVHLKGDILYMKRIISLLVMLITMAMLLCACGKFECDLCGDEKTGKKYKGELFGQEVVYCADCREDLEDLADLFN